MKNIIVLLFLIPMVALSQGIGSVRTEKASNKYKRYVTAQTGDTLFVKATSIASGSSIPAYNTVGYLDKVVINTSVANDTIQLLNGKGIVAQIILGASPPAYPYSVPYECRLDTSLIYIQKKTSSVTLIYRTGY